MFTNNEMTFMVNALQGVRCTPETFAGNLWGHFPYSGESGEAIEPNILLGKVAALSGDELVKLHGQISRFWEGQEIPSIEDRMEEVGLIEWINWEVGQVLKNPDLPAGWCGQVTAVLEDGSLEVTPIKPDGSPQTGLEAIATQPMLIAAGWRRSRLLTVQAVNKVLALLEAPELLTEFNSNDEYFKKYSFLVGMYLSGESIDIGYYAAVRQRMVRLGASPELAHLLAREIERWDTVQPG